LEKARPVLEKNVNRDIEGIECAKFTPESLAERDEASWKKIVLREAWHSRITHG